MNNWDKGYNNTKIFEVTEKCAIYLHFTIDFLQGCRNCNEITPLKNMCKKRQLIGNVYQSLCNCSKCGKEIIFDEYKYDLLLNYLKIQKKCIATNERQI